MAQRTTKSKSPATRRGNSGNGRKASQKTEKYRFAQNVDGQGTAAEAEYERYATEDGDAMGQEPDVLLDVPVLKVDSLHLEVDNLDAHVALQAKVLDLVNLNVGVDVHLGKLELDIKGVEAQALVKVRLDHVTAIVDRVLTTLDRNPDLVKSLGKAVEDVGSGAGHVLGESGEAIEDVGEGAGQAVDDVGEGAGSAVEDVGEGAGQAVDDVGEGAGKAVGEVGEGAGEAAGEVGEGAGEAVGDVGEGAGEAVGEVGEGAGEAVGGVAGGAGGAGGAVEGATDAVGGATDAAGDAVGGATDAVGGATDAAGDIADAGAGTLTKAAAKTVAKEIGAAATDEAKDLGLAAARKAREIGQRRRHRRAERHHATDAALAAAQDLDVDLGDVEGTGSDGRITINDVRSAAAEE
ncbi:MAG TPA: E3 binding domain-containing protein [Thermoleophilaceae bacterium]|nr:E3 binding domain-containing protein [Thermoleophilaceae bacterium]